MTTTTAPLGWVRTDSTPESIAAWFAQHKTGERHRPHLTGSPQSVHGGPGGSYAKQHPLQETVLKQGGASLHLDGSQPSDGYMVAERGGIIMKQERFFDDSGHGEQAMADFVREHQDRFDDPDMYIGLWHDRAHGEVTIELSLRVADRDAAVALGSANNQQAIYDVVAGDTIDTGGTGDRSGEGQADHRAAAEASPRHDGRGAAGVGEAGEGVPAPEADLEGLSLRHPNHKTGTTQKVHAGLGSFGGRISDLPEDVRKHLDAYAEKYGVDVAGMDADLDAAFSDAKAVESGRDWYEKEFHQNASALAEKYGFTDEQAVGVIAITSARTFWETGNGRKPNLELAERFMDAERNGPAKGLSAKEAGARYSNGYIPGRGFAENAYALLKGEQTPQEAVTGAKRSSFYNNGANPSTSRDVTVDVFMGAYMAKNSDRPLKSVQSDLSAKPPQYLTKQGIACSPAYLIIADAILRASDRHAAEVGYTVPSQTQAAAWVYAKDNFSLKELGA